MVSLTATAAYIGSMVYLGELAGLATAVLWSFTSIFFTQAGRLVGSFNTNNIRLLMAVFLYAGFSLVTTGSLYPQEVNSQQWFWLGLSGIVGLVIGDGCGFQALVLIGPRLTTLLYASAPVMTTIIAWGFLGEQLSLWDLLGIVVTIGGVSWVVMERKSGDGNSHKPGRGYPGSHSLLKGVMLGFVAALGQAVGLVLAKYGMLYAGGSVEPMPAAFIRMVVSLVAMGAITIVRGETSTTLRAIKNRRALAFCAAGAVVGPFLGVWMSLVAVKYIAAGLASTLNSTTPVMVLPLVILWYKEKVSLRATLGAVLTVCGVALIFLF